MSWAACFWLQARSSVAHAALLISSQKGRTQSRQRRTALVGEAYIVAAPPECQHRFPTFLIFFGTAAKAISGRRVSHRREADMGSHAVDFQPRGTSPFSTFPKEQDGGRSACPARGPCRPRAFAAPVRPGGRQECSRAAGLASPAGHGQDGCGSQRGKRGKRPQRSPIAAAMAVECPVRPRRHGTRAAAASRRQ